MSKHAHDTVKDTILYTIEIIQTIIISNISSACMIYYYYFNFHAFIHRLLIVLKNQLPSDTFFARKWKTCLPNHQLISIVFLHGIIGLL